MNIPIHTNVECSDGPCGKSTQVIFNPINYQITHFVLENNDLKNEKTRLVPVSNVAKATEEKIQLNCTIAEVENMSPFITKNFVRENIPDDAFRSYEAYVSQYVILSPGYDETKTENIPEGELAIYSGMEIRTNDDNKVGKLDQLVLEPGTGKITHIIMREGHLWGKKEISIPVSEIDFCDGSTVYLKLDKGAVGDLPVVRTQKA